MPASSAVFLCTRWRLLTSVGEVLLHVLSLQHKHILYERKSVAVTPFPRNMSRLTLINLLPRAVHLVHKLLRHRLVSRQGLHHVKDAGTLAGSIRAHAQGTGIMVQDVYKRQAPAAARRRPRHPDIRLHHPRQRSE